MKEIKQEISGIKSNIKKLQSLLEKRGIELKHFLDDMIECLSFIMGYAERALEQNEV